MEIGLGAHVLGRHGPLGEVQRVIVDAQTARITDLVVRHRGLRGQERIVPLAQVRRVAGDTVTLDLDEAGFAALDGFVPDRYHAAEPDAAAPVGTRPTAYLIDAAIAGGPTVGGGGTGGPVGGYPRSQSWPNNTARAAVAVGTPVRDVTGTPIGTVHAFRFARETGALGQLSVRRGHLVHHDTPLPLAWLKAIGDDGILLTVPARQVAALATAPPTAPSP